MQSVAIIVVTYNRLQLLQEVVASLRNQTYTNNRIIIVNNGSTDGTTQWLTNQTDLIVIHQNNVGGAGGFFTGMKYAAEQGFDFCYIMDDDVICSPTALQELINAYNVEPNIGFVCSRVLSIDGNTMNAPSAIDLRRAPNGELDYHKHATLAMIKVRIATFASILIPTNIIFEVGLPYREYFIWGDDSEYTQRISANHTCYIACRSSVVHKRAIQGALDFNTETNPQRLKNYFYYYRNTLHRLLHNASLLDKFKQFLFYHYKAISLILQARPTQAKIIIKAYYAHLFFNPKITFPQKQK